MPRSEVCIQRDEIIRLSDELEMYKGLYAKAQETITEMTTGKMRNDLVIANLKHKNKELVNENEMLRSSNTCDPDTCKHVLELKKANARLAYYENAFSPPSANSILTMQRKANAQKEPTTHKQSGRPKGHPGVSQTRQSIETIYHKDETCPNCSNVDITYNKSYQGRVSDLPAIPKVETKTHVGYGHHCNSCGHEWDSTEQIPKIEGTEIGPNLASHIGACIANNQTQGMIKEQLKTFGLDVSKSTVNNFTTPFANSLKEEVKEIWKQAESTVFVKYDETTHGVPERRRGYVWVCVTDNHVLVKVTNTRSSRILDEHFTQFKNKPTTVDGYCAYPRTKKIQRCWSHVLIDSKHTIDTSEDKPATQLLHEELQEILHIAKGRPPGDVSDLSARILAIADKHEELGHKFATTLRNAEPNLLTFVQYPGMDPTNNETERWMRLIAIHRRTSFRFKSPQSMEDWSIIWTFVLTCRKQGKNVQEELLRVFLKKTKKA